MAENQGKVSVTQENKTNTVRADDNNGKSVTDHMPDVVLDSNQTEVKESQNITNSRELLLKKEETLNKQTNETIDNQKIVVSNNTVTETTESKKSLIENKRLLTPDEQKARYDKLKSYIEWNSIEELYNSKYLCFCGRKVEINYIPATTFTETLMEKMRMSFIGCFLEHLNSHQSKDHQTYETKVELAEFIIKLHEDPMLDRNNDVCKDVVAVIKKAVDKRTTINSELVFSCMWNLRLANCMVTGMDPGVKKLKKLQMLSLSANWISDLEGSVLPRNLKFLELFCNIISDISNLCRGLPSTLCHLGLARNKLSDGSSLHLLRTSRTLNLRTLDLGENDICDLLNVLHAVTGLVNLVGLTLHGNPCSTCSTYLKTTLKYLPNLIYLDNVELWVMDRKQPTVCNIEDHIQEGCLIFKCFRLMGIPKPSPQTVDKQKVEQTYHIEVELPLLDPTLREMDQLLEPTEPESDIVTVPEEKEEKIVRKIGTGKKKVKGDRKKEEKGEEDKKNIEDKLLEEIVDDEAEAIRESERLSKKRFCYFKTQRMPWSPIIEFPDPALEIPAPELLALRDTLRSKVNVKVIFMKTLPPQLKKKGDESKRKRGEKYKEEKDIEKKKDEKRKGKKDNKKEKSKKENEKENKKKGKVKDKTVTNKDLVKKLENRKKQEVITEEEVTPPQERVLQRLMLANFDVQLQQVVWSEKTIDYTWSAGEDNRRPPPEAKLAPRSLLELQYENKDDKKQRREKKGKSREKSKGNKSKSKSMDKRNKLDGSPRISHILPIPNVLTCEMGFGLKRIQDPVPSLPPEECYINTESAEIKESVSNKRSKNRSNKL